MSGFELAFSVFGFTFKVSRDFKAASRAARPREPIRPDMSYLAKGEIFLPG